MGANGDNVTSSTQTSENYFVQTLYLLYMHKEVKKVFPVAPYSQL